MGGWVDDIIATVEKNLNVEKSLERKVGMYLCHHYSGATLRDIGEKFGVGESAVSQGSRRIQETLAEDEALRGEIDLICRILGVVNV